MTSLNHNNSSLRAIIDIGSNGIRFSISSVEPTQARILPCLFQDRAAISLFDALHSSFNTSQENTRDIGETSTTVDRHSISLDTIEEVIKSLVRFKAICRDFGVPDANVRVIATEATREAPNSVEFRQALAKATGWDVLLLSKSEEGRTGAYGVASSFFEVQGLFMDMGGGSVQISWITCKDGKLKMSETPVSLPYGAAALTRRLVREPRESLSQELKTKLKTAIAAIDIPESLKKAADESGGFKLYVCGGGFRGLGHVLLATHEADPHPLPIINGFACTGADISHIAQTSVLQQAFEKGPKKIFRVSSRRASQLPAVALLVSATFEVFPHIRKVLFSQGGVREGALFHDLPSSIKSQDPLLVCTKPYAPLLASRYVEVVLQAVPESAPKVIRERIVKALANVAFIHSSYPKELQPWAGLNIASTGVISGCHGLSHEVRALLGVALCQRWGGELPNRSLKDAFIHITNPTRLAWWACYCGHIMHVIGGVYPGGNVRDHVISLRTRDVTADGFTLVMDVVKDSIRINAPMVRARIEGLEKRLKRTRKEFFHDDGLKVAVQVNWVSHDIDIE
jgi:retrograde regulation protein 2